MDKLMKSDVFLLYLWYIIFCFNVIFSCNLQAVVVLVLGLRIDLHGKVHFLLVCEQFGWREIIVL